MTDHPLFSHWIKLKWAHTRILELQESIKAWLESREAYLVEMELDPEHREQLRVYVEMLQDAPTRDWGVLIGEICHDLRSALDHLVWSLTELQYQAPSPRRSLIQRKASGQRRRPSPWGSLSFPIWKVPGPAFRFVKSSRVPNGLRKHSLIRWADKKPPRVKWGLSDPLVSKIESHQPFRLGRNAIKHPLAILQDLSNIDKHRHMHLLVPTVELFELQRLWPLSHGLDRFVQIIRKSAPRVGEGRQEVARLWRVDGRPFDAGDTRRPPTALFNVAFDYGAPIYRGQVIPVMEHMYAGVQSALADFESEFAEPSRPAGGSQ